MNNSGRRVLLFVLCAIVLLGAGYAWGYSKAYDHFYGPDAALDRELVHLDFNSRVLHYVNLRQEEKCRLELVTQLNQQMTFVASLLGASSGDTKADGGRKLRAAERAVAGQSIKEGKQGGEAAVGN